MTATGQSLPGLEQQAAALKAEYENSWSFLSGDQQRAFRFRVADARSRAASFGRTLVGLLGKTDVPARRNAIQNTLARVNSVHAVLTRLHQSVQRIGFGQNESWEGEVDDFSWNDFKHAGAKAAGAAAMLLGLTGSAGGQPAAPLRDFAKGVAGMTAAERDKKRPGVNARRPPAPGRQPPPSSNAMGRTRQAGPWMTADAGFREAEAELLGEADGYAMPRQPNRQQTRQNRQAVPAVRSRAGTSREKRITTAASAAASRGVAAALARATFAPPALAEFEALAEGDGKPSAIAEIRAKFRRLLHSNLGQALVRAGTAFARDPTTLRGATFNAIASLAVDGANNATQAMSADAADQIKPAVAAAIQAAAPLIEAAARSSNGEQEHALGFAPRYRASRL